MYLDIIFIIGIIIFMIINIVVETAITTFIPSKLLYFYKEHRNYQYVKNFKEQISEILFILLLLDNFFQYIYSTLVANFCLKYTCSPAIIGGILFIIIIIFETIIKRIVVKNPERSILEFAYYTSVLNQCIRYIFSFFPDKSKKEETENDNLLFEINMKSTHDAMTGNIMKNILKIKSVYTEDIMTQKENIISLEMKNTYQEIMEDIREQHFTSHIPDYIPMWLDNKYNFVKLLNVKTFLNNYIQGKYEDKNAFEEVFYVSSDTSTYKLLHLFKKSFKEFAFVVNEEGDVRGIVTTQDLLEEIVGDELFEHKSVAKEIMNQNDKFFTIHGDANLDELNRICNLNIQSNGIYTIGEFIVNDLKRIPEKGEIIHYKSCSILIVARNQKKIITVLISVND